MYIFQEIITPEEKIFWKKKIFTNENFNLVKRASKTRKSKQNGISQRVQVIQDIVTNNIGSKVNVFRFDDDTDEQVQLEYDQILKYIKDRFTKLISEDKKKNKSNNSNDKKKKRIIRITSRICSTFHFVKIFLLDSHRNFKKNKFIWMAK